MRWTAHGWLALSVVVFTAALASAQPPVNRHARILADFKDRVDQYVELRDKVRPREARLDEKAEPEEIAAAERALAAKIRAARSEAKPGEFFTPETRTVLRRLLNPELKGRDGQDTKAAIREDNPGTIPFKVNGTYPKDAPLATMPPNVLAALPELPEGLEYRFIDKHLILRDVEANLIVDYMLNAMP
jgi:hypothetical protein